MKKFIGIFVCVSLLFSCNDGTKPAEPTKEKAVTETAPAELKDYEIGSDKYADMGKNGQNDLVSGNIDSWMNSFADNAIYRWNNGDSVAGKTAIAAYWKKRRAEVLDSISFTNVVWLPIKVNKPAYAGQLTGNYALGWYMLYAKYKTGKSITQRSHMVIHFDDNDKIDRTTLYLDRAPINAAMIK